MIEADDPRLHSILSRLSRLPSEVLIRFLDYDRPIVYDTYNYDSSSDSYCPIAIMLGVEDKLKDIGTVKGMAGKFYTTDRETDIKNLCQSILKERSEAGANVRTKEQGW